MKRKMVFPLLLLLFLPFLATAQLIAYEDFNYSAGSLVGKNGGVGWLGAWAQDVGGTPSNAQQVNATGLSYGNLPAAGGRAVEPATDTRNFRMMDTSNAAFRSYMDSAVANAGTIRATYGRAFGKSGTTIWFGFLIKAGATSQTSYGGMHLMDGMDLSVAYGDKPLHQRFQMGKNHDTHWGLYRTTNSYTGITSQNFNSTVAADANTHLLVYRFDFLSGDHSQGWLWVDPVPGIEPSTSNAAIHATGLYDFHFNAVNIGSDGSFDFDELRIGLTYPDVVPSSLSAIEFSAVSRPRNGFALIASPEPFASSTDLCFILSALSPVRLRIFNPSGVLVSTIINEPLPAGLHHVRFNGQNLRSGTFLCRLEAEGAVKTRKIQLIR